MDAVQRTHLMDVEEMKPRLTFEQEPLWDFVFQKAQRHETTSYGDMEKFLADRGFKHTKAEKIIKSMKRDRLLQFDRDGGYTVDFGKDRESRLEEILQEYYTKSIWVYIAVSIFLVGIPFGWFLGAKFGATIQIPTSSIVGTGLAGLLVLILMPLLQRAIRR